MHAYLIIAHDNFEQLQALLKSLDYVDNYIYLHIDVKAESFDYEKTCSCIKKAGIELIERKNVVWGDFSQIECELSLLEAASKKEYDYVHLLSGVDFPIKSHEYIVDFFSRNKGAEFVHFECDGYPEYDKCKIQYWYMLQKKVGKKKSINSIIAAIQRISILFQMLIGIDRTKNQIKFFKGANWFSITGECALYVVKQKELIEKLFKHTLCGDEFFLQTIIMNSEYKDRLWIKDKKDDYEGCLRMIDWKRGNPYVFRIEDAEELIESKCLFARKFDLNVDKMIIDKLSHL